MGNLPEEIGAPEYDVADGLLVSTSLFPELAEILSDVPLLPPDPSIVDALFLGPVWGQTSLTFSFPQLASDYNWPTYSSAFEPYPDFFIAMKEDGQAIFAKVFAQWSGVSGLDLSLASPGIEADIQVAGTTVTTTAWSYGPGSQSRSGDIWVNLEKGYNSTFNDSSGGYLGGYAYAIAMHESGHSIGLKHPHEGMTANPKVLSLAYDSLEFTVMSYRSFTGDSSAGAWNNERWGYPQSLMMLDIAALQQLYGADYGTAAGDTHYYFDPDTGEMVVDGLSAGIPGANRLFRSIWDGAGTDVLDFSDYTTDLRVDLRAGYGTDVDVGGMLQRAKLGRSGGEDVHATNHLYMSLLFEENTSSLIENAIGGAGADVLIGNEIDNFLRGGLGADLFTLGAGADTVAGSLAEIDGDAITDFSAADSVLVSGALLRTANLNVSDAGGVSIDGDGDALFETAFDLGTGFTGVLRADLIGGGTALTLAAGGEIALSALNDEYWYYGTGALVLDAGNGDDLVVGGAGNDDIKGGEGSDFLKGGAGNDTLEGGGGTDNLFGGAGSDLFVFRAGETTVGFTFENLTDFVAGTDRIYLEGFAATSLAELGAFDTQSGAIVPLSATHYLQLGTASVAELSESDFIFSSDTTGFGLVGVGNSVTLTDQTDRYRSTGSQDRIVHAGAGDDLITLSSGNDTAYGGSGSDIMYGRSGNDRIIGGAGADRVFGQNGADTFVFSADEAAAEVGFVLDYISDFTMGVDLVELVGFAGMTAGDFQMFDSGDDIFMLLSATNSIVFENVTFDSTALIASNSFVFV